MPPPAYLQRYWRALKRPVGGGNEFKRIDALPRRKFDAEAYQPVDWERELWIPGGCGSATCPYRNGLLPTQRAAVQEGVAARGLLGSMGLGHGKTLTSFLLATLLTQGTAVLLVPPSLRQQTEQGWEHLSKHWRLRPVHVVAYSELSSPTKGDVLERLKPAVIIADEAHCLAHATSVRTKRFMAYFKAHPDTVFCALSGTLTARSIRDWAHLAWLALREGSPAPHYKSWKTLEAWSFAIDDLGAGMDNAPGGVLDAWRGDEETTREGYSRRVRETPGVVATSSFSSAASLVIRARPIKVPQPVTKALDDLRRLWVRPDGVELSSALEFYRYARQLSMGFYLRWVTPAPEAWLEARRAWCSERSRFLAGRTAPGLDSPALYEAAVEAGRVQSTNYGPWKAIEKSFRPETEAVWISDFMVNDAAEAAVKRPLVVWSRHPAFGSAVAERAGIPYYGAGKEAERALIRECEERGDRSIVASVGSHGFGRNMQTWDTALWPGFSVNGKTIEQCLGRLHRQGQRSDEVEYQIYLHTPEAGDGFAAALSNSRYQQQSFRQPQRLLSARLAGRGLEFYA